MSKNTKQLIIYSSLTVVGLYFLFHAVIKAQSFFIPLVIGILLAMLVVPVARKLEGFGIARGWSAFLSDLLLIGFSILLFWVIGLQINQIRKDWPQLKKEMVKQAKSLDSKLDQFSWLQGEKGISLENKLKNYTNSSQSAQDTTTNQNSSKQKASSNQNSGSSSGGSSISAGGIWQVMKSFFGFLGSMLLVFIYVFFFLLYRDKFKKSVLQFVPSEKNDETKSILTDSANVAQQYLWGKLILIIFLAIFYSIGLSISGIKYAIFISIIAAVLSLIPYIGNLIGAVFAALMALLASGSGFGPLIGVAITFTITQFIESYVLEPYIVGHKVHMNPVMTILAVVFGELIWGVPGMVLAIPVLGIIKVICDHIEPLKPVGYTIGEEGIDSGGDNFLTKYAKKIKSKLS